MRKTIVVKFGGSLGRNQKARNAFLGSIAKLSKKAKIVLVHGGGPEINHWLNALNIKSRFVSGLRVTDAKTLEIVEMVLSGKVNKSLAAELNSRGVPAVGISGRDAGMVVCKRIKKLGFVGEPVKVNVRILRVMIDNGFLPVISSLACDSKGGSLNVNADLLAMAVAAALRADKLILLTDVPGVLDADKKTISCIRVPAVKKLLADEIITGGMIPKVRACCRALTKGVKEVRIADGARGLNKLNGTVIKK